MSYQWDSDKATSNRCKHGVDFADTVVVFGDDLSITVEDKGFEEERFTTIGIDALGRILVVVYTLRDQDVRLISARKATRTKRQQYQEG